MVKLKPISKVLIVFTSKEKPNHSRRGYKTQNRTMVGILRYLGHNIDVNNQRGHPDIVSSYGNTYLWQVKDTYRDSFSLTHKDFVGIYSIDKLGYLAILCRQTGRWICISVNRLKNYIGCSLSICSLEAIKDTELSNSFNFAYHLLQEEAV